MTVPEPAVGRSPATIDNVFEVHLVLMRLPILVVSRAAPHLKSVPTEFGGGQDTAWDEVEDTLLVDQHS